MQKIAVIGAGLMGHAITLVMARAGHEVAVFDPVEAARRALPGRVRRSLADIGTAAALVAETLARIVVAESLVAAVGAADMVIEAAPENLELKRGLFAEMEAAAAEQAILATNTSVMPISSIVSGLRHRKRAIGTHWWNPGHMIPLVEVIRTEWTDEATTEATAAILACAGKTPVRVEQDVPGFIGNRLQHALWREAVSLVERGICNAEAVDIVIKASFGRRLAVLGPLENADLVGTDLTLAIHETVLADLERRPGPSPYLKTLVAEGKLGMKTGQGFRSWTEDQADATRLRVTTHLQKLEGILDS